MSVMAGVPLYIMEVALGQYFAEGTIGTWRIICPLTRGNAHCFNLFFRVQHYLHIFDCKERGCFTRRAFTRFLGICDFHDFCDFLLLFFLIFVILFIVLRSLLDFSD